MKRLLTALTVLISFTSFAQRSEVLLEKNWKFHRGDVENAQAVVYDDASWQNVTVPHDWAIYGPFSRDNDLQYKAVFENGEEKATWKTGRTGGLPYEGVGWYRTTFNASKMPSSHLILCHPLLLLPPIPPSIRVFSNESALHMRWPKY